MFPIPWYVAAFESIPEGFLIVLLSLKLMKQKELVYSKIAAISIVYGMIAYATRNMNAYFYNTIPPYLYNVLLLVALTVLMKHICKADFQAAIISVFIVLVIFGLVQYIFVLILAETFKINYDTFYKFPWMNVILFIPVAAITFFIVHFYSINQGAWKMNKRYLTALFAVAVQLMTVLMLNQILFASDSDIYYKNLPIIILSLSALAFIFYFLLKYIESSSKKETELKALECHLRDIEELIKTFRAERHANIQNMQTIQSLAFLGKYADLKQYLNKIVGNYRSVEKVLRLGDMALTALVNVKIEMMQRNNIDFEVKYSGLGIYNTKLDSFELSTVVGNVIDNAIEAVMERQSDRIIYFEVDENPKSYMVKISNNGPPIKEADFKKIYDAGYSTKHKDTRGFGLYIVKKIMDKYNGTIQLNSDEKLTSFTLFIPRKGGMDVAEAFSKAVTDTKIPTGM